MCGIVGLVGYASSSDAARDVVTGMNSRIAHRGPDSDGIVVHPDATLAMKRLAIVDTEHGSQPMATANGDFVIVYNGEVYNAPALRLRLEREGVQFRTRSDTEVILRLYERDPDDVERHLVGMWAFAIHDRKRRRVVLSRDRFGIKPLFVADTGTALAFASELTALPRDVPGFSGLFAVDHDAAHAMLSWSYIPENATIYTGVRRLPPATRLTVDLTSGERRSERFWSLVPSAEAARVGSFQEACLETERLLRRSVAEHLESDVPIATFLSGGIDSSLVSAYAADAAPGTIKGYTIGFADPRFDESSFARATAERIGIPLSVASLDEAGARARLADALLAYDEPFGDSSSLATFFLSSQVGATYKVALGGDGGDEVFAGYKKHQVVNLRRLVAKAPRARDTLGRILGVAPAYYDRTRRWTELLRTVRRVSRGLTGSDAHVYTSLTQVAPLARTAPLVRAPRDPEVFVRQAIARFEEAAGDELQRTLAADLGSVLCNDMLVKVDRASMACHLEVRVPMLDHRVVEWGVGLPSAMTLGGSRERAGKRVLRALHEQRFGAALANRKKQGFGVPVEAWLRGPFDQACERLFDRKRLDRMGILASAELSDGGFRRWLRRDPLIVWNALALAAWAENHHGDGPSATRELLRES